MSHHHDYTGPERRHIDLTDARLQMLHEDVGDIKAAIKELTSAITRLALVEQRMVDTSQAQERAFAAIAAVERRITEIEKKIPEYSKASIWVDRAVWGTLAAAGMYLLKRIGVLS